jgi:hypothetical protein
MRILMSGERLEAICERCADVVEGTYQYRPVRLENTGVEVPNVLVGVCGRCDEIVSIPAQSTPRLKEARERHTEKVPLRFPRELEDVMHLAAAALKAPSDAVAGLLVRYYLQLARKDPSLLRRVAGALANPILQQPRSARASVNVDGDTLREVERAMPAEGIRSRSDLIRGVLLVAGEDILDNRAPKRRQVLMEMAGMMA